MYTKAYFDVSDDNLKFDSFLTFEAFEKSTEFMIKHKVRRLFGWELRRFGCFCIGFSPGYIAQLVAEIFCTNAVTYKLSETLLGEITATSIVELTT